jgi:cell division protein FtsI/penicillin-binding protein 2
MGSLAGRNCALILLSVVVGFSAFGHAQVPRAGHESLFSQSAAGILERDYTDADTSYLLLDVNSGALLASHWQGHDKPIPLGSLVKPFTALAYADGHAYRYPIYECKGKAGGCWQPVPHGKLDITSAVSVSCNAYFRQMAEAVSLEQVSPVAQAFGLERPDAGSTSPNLIGLGESWRISPIHMAQAYLELLHRKNQPGVAPILEGMRLSAKLGTGAGVDRGLKHATALAKTGTASCTHSPKSATDGFVVVLVPADQPEILLLMRVHGGAGAQAAELAGQALGKMEE